MSRRKINQITVLLLLLGFGSALIIQLMADSAPEGPLLDDPLATKRYLRQMQMIGGQANVLAADFRNWFTGLWQGEALAKTVIVLTVGVTLVFRFVALNPGTAAEIPADETPPRENIKP